MAFAFAFASDFGVGTNIDQNRVSFFVGLDAIVGFGVIIRSSFVNVIAMVAGFGIRSSFVAARSQAPLLVASSCDSGVVKIIALVLVEGGGFLSTMIV